MKKILILLLLVITLTLSTACLGLIYGILGDSSEESPVRSDRNPVDDGILMPTPLLPADNNNPGRKDPGRNNTGNNDPGRNNQGNDQGNNNPGNNTPSTLSAESARAIAREWLKNHPVEDGPNTLDSMYFEITHNNKEYYQFFLTTPQMYWFNIIVQKQTGEMLLMIIEDGMDGGIYIEPLDAWYSNAFENRYSSSGIDQLWAAILDAQNYGTVVVLQVFWENGSQTTFYNDYFDGWYMISRVDGNQSKVSPDFSQSNTAIEIRFPTTTRVYYLYDDYTGIFGDEKLTWDFIQP